MRLILAAPAFYPDSAGGAARQARILAEALHRAGVDVTLATPTISKANPATEETSFGRIERFYTPAYPNLGGRHFMSFLRWTLWFRNKFGSARYSGIPIYVFHARLHALGPALAAMSGRSPLLLKLGGGGEASDFAALRDKKFFYGRLVQQLLVKRVNRFVANGSQIVQDLHDLGVPPERVAAFSNGVVLPPRDELEASLDKRTGDRFIFTGRVVADKRIHVLVDAALSLAQGDKPARMVFLGDGPDRERLIGLAGAVDPGLVSFPGHASDVYPELSKSDFFVSASMREGQSNSLLEAMSMGVIPIVYAASGVADVVDHGKNGFIVQASEPEAFAEAMRTAMALSPAARREMAEAGRTFAERNIGIDAIAGKTRQTLLEVIEEMKAA
jgi:glycosyltransferase involved in cell wall biosynthesis